MGVAPALAPRVQHLRHVLLWPLRLMPVPGSIAAGQPPWQVLRDMGDASPWREVVDEFDGSAGSFHERHYNEFVTFLPYVQRFLYGEGRSQRAGELRHGDEGGSPMRVFRRRDVAAAHVITRPGEAPVQLSVVHIDLYFFFDVDVVLLNVELSASDLPLPIAHEVLYRFGRGYPAGWDADGQAQHCMAEVQWLGPDGAVLATSDAQDRDGFLAHVAEHRAPRIASHWAHLLLPLVPDHSAAAGPLRFRQIEYYRMPLMAYLGLDDPRALTRADFIRLGLVTGMGGAGGEAQSLPYGEQHLADFEARYCYDRFWADAGAAPNTRYLCCGHALVVVGRAGSEFFACGNRGVLAQFRHQHFMLFLIAHFQKAALLMFSDRLAEALRRLDITRPSSIRQFKRAIRDSFASFLRFTHRYWFHEISEQAQVRALFRMCSAHLGIDALYDEVKDRIGEMNDYLDADSLRRQANTVVRLTVVTIFGLIGTVTTGFLGMNLIAEADAPIARRIGTFAGVLVLTIVLTFYTITKSKGLSDFLDALSDERLSSWKKVKMFLRVWRPGGGGL